MRRLSSLVATLVLVTPGLSHAGTLPLDTAMTYQGELSVSGAPANGVFDLQACLFDVAAAGAPLVCAADIDDLPIGAGRFTLPLDFGAVFAGQQRFLELRVRAGESDGGYTALQPRQLLRPAPEALHAASADWSGLNGVPATLVDGDDAGVTQITAGDGLSGGTIVSAGTIAVQVGGISSAMLAPGAVGLGQIDTTQVQARIAGQCAGGHYLRGIAGDGMPDCALLPVPIQRTLDSSLGNGEHVAMVLHADGRPVLAYHESGNGGLRHYDCADAACSDGQARSLVTTGDAGENNAIALRPDGRPAIAFREAGAQILRFYNCANPACAGGSTRTLDDTVLVGTAVAMVVRADSRPLVAYEDRTNFSLRVYDCADVECTTGVSHGLSTSNFDSLSMGLRADGRAFIALSGSPGPGIRVRTFECANVACSSGTTRNVTQVVYDSVIDMVIRADGRPLLATALQTGSSAIYACTDAACTATTRTELPACAGSASLDMQLRSDGRPLIVCNPRLDINDYQILAFDCDNATCTGGSVRNLLRGDYQDAVSMALRDDDRAVVAYHDDANDDVALYICAHPDCS